MTSNNAMDHAFLNSKHKFWWLWLPLAFVAGELVFEQVAPHEIVLRAVSEDGLIELLEFFVAALGFIFGVLTFLKLDFRTQTLLKIWIGLGALGCLYIAGEEISWGQWFFHWSTPEVWQAVNDQGETNLHNISSWFDQKPRLLLEIGVVTGGLVLPWLLRRRPALVPSWLQVLTPPPRLGVIAALYVFVRLADWLSVYAGHGLYERSSEIFECAMFYFVLLYILYVRDRYVKTP